MISKKKLKRINEIQEEYNDETLNSTTQDLKAS